LEFPPDRSGNSWHGDRNPKPKKFMKRKMIQAAMATGLCLFGASCTTAYDAYGRPIQTVDPGAAVVGAAAAGAVGYAAGRDTRTHRHYHPAHRHRMPVPARGYYGPPGFYR
jgi:NADPH-dependent curcumin reductase CurA